MIRLIAAMDSKNGIAKNGGIPWDLPKDRQYFKQKTLSKGVTILMGRKTYESIGRKLPDRRNIVLSHDKIPEVETVNSLDILQSLPDVWVIGGESVYQQTINIADELYLTVITGDFSCDKFFPDFSKFKKFLSSEMLHQNGLDFQFLEYKKLVNFRY